MRLSPLPNWYEKALRAHKNTYILSSLTLMNKEQLNCMEEVPTDNKLLSLTYLVSSSTLLVNYLHSYLIIYLQDLQVHLCGINFRTNATRRLGIMQETSKLKVI